MKKSKLKLKDLNIQSFTTSTDQIKGGNLSIWCYQPTDDCPSEPVTLLGEGEFGFCQAYTDNNPVCLSNLPGC